MNRSLFDLNPKSRTKPQQLDTKLKLLRHEMTPILYIQHNPSPNVCPYCDQPFSNIVGCHKICRCGYMEGCGD